MNMLRIEDAPTHADIDWTPFPGGELEGQRDRARVLCPACREQARRPPDERASAGRPALCFQCYRTELERNRAIKAAAELNTASEARFQSALPFEPVNTSRLARLKVERESARVHARVGAGVYVERRRRAQIAARHALARIVKGLNARRLADATPHSRRESVMAMVAHAAELQLPESWLPFVVSQ
jgi:hypothetical protein